MGILPMIHGQDARATFHFVRSSKVTLIVKPGSQTTTAYVALGANLGDRKANIAAAARLLDASEHITLTGMSNLVESEPLGPADQPEYMDAAACIETDLAPQALFEKMVSIEDQLGRAPGKKWGPRTIDLDLLLYGGEVISSPALIVPHSQMHLRSFVLKGMCELNGELMHPVLKQPMNELAARLNGGDFFLSSDRAQLISIAGIIGVGKTTLARGLAQALDCAMIAEAYDTNPYMPQVYAGRKDLALDSQLYFLNSREEQLGKDKLTPGAVAVSDYVFDKEMIFATRTLSPEQLDSYMPTHDAVAAAVAECVLAVYLYDSPAACMSRIDSRNRPYEKVIDLPALEAFAQDYDRLFAGWRKCPVIRLDAGRFNCRDAAQISILADEVRHYVWKSPEK